MTKKKEDLKPLKVENFGDNFKWGVSSAAFQIEGSPKADGKEQSIWDVFTSRKGKIFNNHKANVACDFYNRYEEDIDLLKSLNIPNFRFSISWARILPNGTGEINMEGVSFYNKVINKCLENNIQPWVTLYHWDLPQKLEEKGGWTSREIITWFSEYTKVCAQYFGDRVKYWMVLNEPLVFTGAGYFLGIHAPGKKGIKKFLAALHHASICQAEGGRVLREYIPNAKIGTTYSCSLIEPYRDKRKDKNAVKRVDALINRLFIEPTLGMGYPIEDLPFLKRMEKFIKPGDEELLRFDFDFIGIQNYTREIVKHSWLVPFLKAKNIKATRRKVPVTVMDWEVYPPAIYEVLHKFNNYEKVSEIYVTENGAAFPDQFEEGKVNDEKRLEFLQRYLSQVLKAKNEGVKVNGYFIWSFTDNFEWAEGYHPRFGLVYIDYETQKRTVKSSGKWYRNFLSPLTRG